MALMNLSTFESYADKIAKQYGYFKVTFDSVSNSAEDQYYEMITAEDEKDVELNMLQTCSNADEFLLNMNTNKQIKSYSSFTALIPAFENAMRADGTLVDQNWDGYCDALTTKVSDFTNQTYWCSRNRYMKARSVWCEEEKSIATCEMNGVALDYIEDENIYEGVYVADQSADGTHFSAVPMIVKVTGSQTIANMTITVEGEDIQGNSGQSEQITITSKAPGEYSTETTASFLKVTNVTLNSGGVDGDTFDIVNTKPRDINS